MPMRLTRCCRNHDSRALWPSGVLSTCSGSVLPSSATSSFRLPVSIPAQIVICLVIFVDPSLVMRTLSSFNHSGPDEVPIAILLRPTALKASMGIDPIERRPNPGGHPGWVIPHGTTTSYHRALIQGWVELFAKPIILASTEVMGFAAL